MSVILNALRAKEAAEVSYPRRGPATGVFIADDEERTNKNVWIMGVLIFLLFAIMILGALKLGAVYLSEPAAQAPVIAQVVVPVVAKPAIDFAQAQALYAAGHVEESLAAFEKLVKDNPNDATILSNMGLILMKQDRLLAAENYLREAIKFGPTCAECFNNMGLLATQKGRTVEAERHFMRAMDLKEDYADPYFNLAVLLEKNGDEAGAMAHFEDFLRHTSDKNSAIALEVKRHLAKLSG